MEDGPRQVGYVSRFSMRWSGPAGVCAQTCSAPRRSLRIARWHAPPVAPQAARGLGFRVVPSPRQLVLLALPLAGAGLLVAAEFTTLYDVRVVTAVPEGGSFSAGGHHGYALAVIAVGIAVMAVGAVLGGSRPAAVAMLVLALGALAIAVFVDLPDVDQTGLIGETYDAAVAEPRAG